MFITIYKIESPSGRIYIGKTKNLDLRLRHYKFYSDKITQPILQASIRKYGWIAHKWDIVEITIPILANEREIFWIDHFKSYYQINKRGMNLTLGGDGGKGRTGKNYGNAIEQRDIKTHVIIKTWEGGVPEAAKAMGIKTPSLYQAIKGIKQIQSCGFLWCYRGNFKKPRENMRQHPDTTARRSALYKKRYADGIFVSSMKGRKGKLAPQSKPVYCDKLSREFESMWEAAVYLKDLFPDKKIKTIAEMVRNSAHGRYQSKTGYNFKFI